MEALLLLILRLFHFDEHDVLELFQVMMYDPRWLHGMFDTLLRSIVVNTSCSGTFTSLSYVNPGSFHLFCA